MLQQTDKNECLSNFSAFWTSSVLTNRTFIYWIFTSNAETRISEFNSKSEWPSRSSKFSGCVQQTRNLPLCNADITTIVWLCLLSNVQCGAEPEILFCVCEMYSVRDFCYFTGFYEQHGYWVSAPCSYMDQVGFRCLAAKVEEVDISGGDGLKPCFIPCLCSTASLCSYNAINK